jgi:hypothetical protein
MLNFLPEAYSVQLAAQKREIFNALKSYNP